MVSCRRVGFVWRVLLTAFQRLRLGGWVVGERVVEGSASLLAAHPTEGGPHCVKDKSGMCHRREITVIYEALSQQQHVNTHFSEFGVLRHTVLRVDGEMYHLVIHEGR